MKQTLWTDAGWLNEQRQFERRHGKVVHLGAHVIGKMKRGLNCILAFIPYFMLSFPRRLLFFL